MVPLLFFSAPIMLVESITSTNSYAQEVLVYSKCDKAQQTTLHLNVSLEQLKPGTYVDIAMTTTQFADPQCSGTFWEVPSGY
jgi:hypothetical protein